MCSRGLVNALTAYWIAEAMCLQDVAMVEPTFDLPIPQAQNEITKRALGFIKTDPFNRKDTDNALLFIEEDIVLRRRPQRILRGYPSLPGTGDRLPSPRR